MEFEEKIIVKYLGKQTRLLSITANSTRLSRLKEIGSVLLMKQVRIICILLRCLKSLARNKAFSCLGTCS